MHRLCAGQPSPKRVMLAYMLKNSETFDEFPEGKARALNMGFKVRV